MSVVCEACKTSNRATAMFCIGCAGRLPAFVATGPSALEAMGVSPSAPRRERAVPRREAPTRTGSPLGWWTCGLAASAVLAAAFAWQVLGGRADPAAPATGTVASVRAQAEAEAPPSPREWLDTAEELVERVAPRTAAVAPALTPLVPAPLARNDIGPDAPARVGAAFSGALAAGDGKAAAAVVTPAKRDVGRFSEAGMTQFYGSFSEPLSVRSIRQIDAHAVEARYTYRATRTVCEGVALVRTERIAQQTVIRSISANC